MYRYTTFSSQRKTSKRKSLYIYRYKVYYLYFLDLKIVRFAFMQLYIRFILPKTFQKFNLSVVTKPHENVIIFRTRQYYGLENAVRFSFLLSGYISACIALIYTYHIGTLVDVGVFQT